MPSTVLPGPMVAPAWWHRPPPPALATPLREVCGGNSVLAALLHARGVAAAEAGALLGQPPAALADPFLLAGMEEAVSCLQAAARAEQPCVVFGDYDGDGLAATALLATDLARLGLRVQTLLPLRQEGYGLAPHHVDTVAAAGVRLLVTVDGGTNAHAALARAVDRGVRVIVTDHHPPRGPLPPAHALLNPQRADSRYPDRDLCGVGVAYTLLRALAMGSPALRPDLDAGLDLVAVGTVADVAPLRGENRALVQRGLPVLARTARPGLRALLATSGVSALTLTARDIAFGLAPRLNAPGRLGDAGPALALLQAQRPRQARLLAADLEELNRRQELTRAATQQAVARLEAGGGPGPLIVTWEAAWHPGVVGLVAARLVERYGRPAVVVGQMEGRWRGSARSVEGFDIGAALGACADLLVAEGGHPLAAGLEAADERALEALRARLEAQAAEMLAPAAQSATVRIDLHLAAAEVDERLAAAVEALEPCGAGWPAPCVVIHGAHLLERGGPEEAPRLLLAGADGMAIIATARPGVLAREVGAGAVLDLLVNPQGTGSARLPMSRARGRHGADCR